MNTPKTGRGNYVRVPHFYTLPPEERIDDPETLKRFGYRAVHLPPSSSKKVVCSCSGCNAVLERVRIRVRAPVLCHSCSKSQVAHGDPTELVDDTETQKQFNYSVKKLSRYSLDKVIGVCSTCTSRYALRMRSVKPGQQCPSCRRKSWCASHLDAREADGHECLNEEETQKQFGYSARKLSPKSFLMVVATCPCGVTYQRIRRNIKDTSTCISCARSRINHSRLQEKRNQTLLEHYPHGMPYPTNYGETAGRIGKQLSHSLDRELQFEKGLSNGQRLDIFDPVTNTGIEYCGLFWHNEDSPTPRYKNYHADKMKAAEKDGYRLVTVFEDEYKSRPEVVMSRLFTILGHSKTQVQARKCQVLSVGPAEAKSFLNEHHIQGSTPAFQYSFGLSYEGKLVGVITGGPHHRQGHLKELVLRRLCFASQIHVTGGTERLFKHLCNRGRDDGYTLLVTWSDNRWTPGTVYARLGMSLDRLLPPDYSYVHARNPSQRFSKQSKAKKHTNCPPGMTEREWMHQQGFSRIWDCGHKRWVFPLLP